MKQVVFNRHARRAIGFLKGNPADVAATLEHPDAVLPSIKGRYNAIRRIGDRFLRVTYKEETERILVITITPRKRPW